MGSFFEEISGELDKLDRQYDGPGGTIFGQDSTVADTLAAIQSEFASLITWALKNPQPLTQGSGIAPDFRATRKSVVDSYVDWTTPLEGFLPWMYIDALGYVTTGMGNLIDPISTALSLPWKNADGSVATQEQITEAWNAVDSKRSDPKDQKQTSGPGVQGGGTQGGLTTLRITKADVQDLVSQKMLQNEASMLEGLKNFADAPADAQLAAHSMAWAMGSGFATKGWPGFVSAFNSGDYTTAAAQSQMKGTGIDNRNAANKLLLLNAAQVVAAKKDADTLYYIPGLSDLYSGAIPSIPTPIGPLKLAATPTAIIASAQAHPYRSIGIAAGVFVGIGTLLALVFRKG